jgi:hypothetical protein
VALVRASVCVDAGVAEVMVAVKVPVVVTVSEFVTV